ncbi:MAG: hypothetical protein K6E84_05210 [Lachnospiraceae bacterium]|nr:hypothetical protein [Lachnospiraceae bacterium]
MNNGIIGALSQCHDVHRKLIELIQKNQTEAAKEVIRVLQDTAIGVGEAIEHDYGKKQAAVSRLEEYCEILYRVYEGLENKSGTVVRAIDMVSEADAKIWKAEVISKRIMGVDVSGQFRTYYDRPKYADEVGILSEGKLKYKTAIVLQGPLKKEEDFTLETVRLYKKLYPDCLIVLSTWDSEKDYLQPFYDEGIIICVNEPPIHSGALNCSFQAKSAHEGIERAKAYGCERICKTRTDQRFYRPELFSYLEDVIDQFPMRIDSIQKNRLIAISYTTFSNRLYHICDMFLYGDSEDVARYFSGRMDERDWELIKWTDNIQYSKLRAGEVWFTADYIESLGYELKWTYEDSAYYLREFFVIIDTDLIDLYWAKYSDNEHPERKYNDDNFQNQRIVTFFDWLHEYRKEKVVAFDTLGVKK